MPTYDYSAVKISTHARIKAEHAGIYIIYRHHERDLADQFAAAEIPLMLPMLNSCADLRELLIFKRRFEAEALIGFRQEETVHKKELNVIKMEYVAEYFNTCCREVGVIPNLVRAEVKDEMRQRS